MRKMLAKKWIPILTVLSFFPPVKARAADPVTMVAGAIVGSVGCGAYLYYRAHRRQSNRQVQIEKIAQVLMALRGSQNLELLVLLKVALQAPLVDFAKIESLVISRYHDDQALIARLRWQLPLLEPRRKPDLLAWLEFDELESARQAWVQLQSAGWKMYYTDPASFPVAGDAMFSIDGANRLLAFSTTPYLTSGPVAAAWAAFSAEAAEKVQIHSTKLRAWAAALRTKYKLNDSEAVISNLVLHYLHKSSCWKKLAAVYHPFIARHPEHKTWLWDGFLFDSKSEHDRNLHVLSTLNVVPRDGLKEFIEELIASDLDALIAAP